MTDPGASLGGAWSASVIIPARDAEAFIGRVVRAVFAQRGAGSGIDVIVVDDGSRDATAERARAAGARVLSRPGGARGNPAAARNQGARAASGDPLIFLDADCVPADGWLEALLAAHGRGAVVVGGSLALPPGLSLTARCDYYCGWYLVHPRRPAGPVPHHPPPNLSVRRAAFLATAGFTERSPLEYTNEERAWQGEVRRAGHTIYFEPAAVAEHYNRPGFRNLLRRNYRWAYTAIEAKSQSGSARAAWLYRYPALLIAGSLPLALAHTAYIEGCWVRAGTLEPLLMLPAVLASRLAYALGMAVGGARWLRRRGGARAVPATLER
ncbi:MAG TPA: glycosyltransferase [Gemmatimonadaceae bacterium]|nr:glycosyltransferase [Gemmatimonadaceae bacterium]